MPTTVELVDIAGLVRGASKGEGLGNQFLAHIREAAAVAHVVRCFEDPNVVHVDGRIDPAGDIEIVGSELALADIANLERRLEKLRRSAKGSKGDAALVEAVAAMIDSLSAGVPARASDIDLPADFDLLTAKPVIYVCNVAEDGISGSNPHVRAVQEIAAEEGGEVVIVSARIEQELSDLAPEEAAEFLVDLGLEEPGLNRLIRIGHQTLGLITFFTGNAKEVHAWTTRQGNRAPRAAAEGPHRLRARLHPGRSDRLGIGWSRWAAWRPPALEAGCAPRARNTWSETGMCCRSCSMSDVQRSSGSLDPHRKPDLSR